ASGYLLHRRWSPCAVEDRGIAFIWPVHSQHQNELACRCGQPVTFLLWSGAVLLDIQVSRTVRARFQVLSRTDRIPVDRVSHKEVLGVIHSDRPEYIVIDQKPSAGGVWPFSEWLTYLFDPS